jgi:hypothetical protein
MESKYIGSFPPLKERGLNERKSKWIPTLTISSSEKGCEVADSMMACAESVHSTISMKTAS